MRIILVFILFLLLGVTETPSHQVAENLSVTSPQTTSESQYLGDSASFHESQIRIADSLYKNYLPQYNFDEVKAAMEFFDSIRNEELAIRNYGGRKAIPNSTFLIPNYQCAKAHYYHAVGLTEKDDIVGACEHYLIALEIMEEMMAKDKRLKANDKSLKAKGKKSVDCCPLSVDNNEDYEKIRFVSLIYNRLGRLFYNENYCGLAILKYRKALEYTDLLKDTLAKANVLKELGNSYQLSSEPDSALYYYNESLRYNSALPNKLDVEKSIAQILYNEGKKYTAYILLKKNLTEVKNENVKYSYHCLLGNLYYNDKEYDSALYYLEESLDDDIITKKIAFTTTLSAVYDSLGNYEKKVYYDNFSSKLFKYNINNEVNKSKLQVLYNNYNERKSERIRIETKTRTRRNSIIVSLTTFIIVVLILIYIKFKHIEHSNKLKNEIDDYVNRIDNYSRDIENKNIIINQKEKLINEYQMTNDNKDKIIDKQKKEIDIIKTRISKKNVNIEAYYASDICKKIVGRKDNDFSCMKEDELALLLDSADKHLDNISERLHNSFSGLNKNDIYTICLLILNVEKGKLQYLLGKDRKTIWNRLNKIKRLMNVNEDHDLFLYIKENFLN